MKQILLAAFLTSTQTLLAQQYVISIDGNTFEIELEQEFFYITEQGDSVRFELNAIGVESLSEKKIEDVPPVEAGMYRDKFIEFSYSTEQAISRTRPDENIQQIMMIDGDGHAIIIQEFVSVDPSSLVDFFLSGLISGSSKETSQSLHGGEVLSGKTGVDSDGKIVSVYGSGNNNLGVLITVIGDQNNPFISAFWSTFKLNF